MEEVKQIDFSQLVGRNIDEVVAEIQASDSTLKVHKVPDGSMVTCDWVETRVRVYYNE